MRILTNVSFEIIVDEEQKSAYETLSKEEALKFFEAWNSEIQKVVKKELNESAHNFKIEFEVNS